MLTSGLKKIVKNQKGFSLIEIMISFMIFSAFYLAIYTRQSFILSDSRNMADELRLHHLCENKLDEIILNPPEFEERLTLSPETKTFEETENQDFEYTIEYKRFEIPNLLELASGDGEEDAGNNPMTNNSFVKGIFEQIKDNIKNAIWQIRVTVKNKVTTQQYSLSTWLKNEKANLNIGPGGSQ